MIKDIQYTGYATEPSDYECPDGQLETSINIINEDGQLKPLFQPSQLAELPSGYIIICLHNTSYFTHHIIQKEQSFYWINEPEKGTIFTESDFTTSNLLKTYENNITIHDVKTIGNTLVILASDSIHYFIWKNNNYTYIGSHIPELPLSFGLQGTCETSEELFDIDLTSHYKSETGIYALNDEDKSIVTSQVMAKTNKLIADKYTNGNQFIFPFFVRYAYRLYDGSLTMHSAPLLMTCVSNDNPVASIAAITNKIGTNAFILHHCKVHVALFQLDFAVVAQKYIDKLKDWSDIVSSVDIFVSAPLYTYDQSGEIKCIMEYPQYYKNNYCVCKANHGAEYSKYYQFHSMSNFLWYGKNGQSPFFFELPMKSSQKQRDNITTASQFYLLKSYKLSQLTTERKIIEIENGYFKSLVNREVMTDDYDSHSVIAAKYGFEYNSRLNIAGINRVLPPAFHMSAMLPFTNGFLQKTSDGNVDTTYETQKQTISMFVYIKYNGKEIVARSYDLADTFVGLMSEAEFGKFTPQVFLYYPNVNAYKAVIYFHEYINNNTIDEIERITCREIPLEQHPMLNGAYFFGDWEQNPGTEVSWSNVNKGSSLHSARSIDIPNKIYTSEVNNPFTFTANGISTVGTGNIIGISSAVKALSQGQFGQFPLYAFTTEGVWALEVSDTGTYIARQPVTRDVCINPYSITQIDNAVLFATERGIMHISGSQTQCITDSIFSEAPFNVLELPGIDQLHNKLGHNVDACMPIKPFNNFLAGCQMVYDYVHQRIFVYNPTKENGTPLYTYAYVFSLKSKMWGMVFTNLASTINAYPKALAMTHDNKLVSFSETDDDVCKALYITRPLKLEAADVHKTISELIQRGHFQRGDVGTVLYGSRDLYTWHIVWSSKDHYLRGFRGTPYKYFRIAGLATLTNGKSIFGASINYQHRHTNQLR